MSRKYVLGISWHSFLPWLAENRCIGSDVEWKRIIMDIDLIRCTGLIFAFFVLFSLKSSPHRLKDRPPKQSEVFKLFVVITWTTVPASWGLVGHICIESSLRSRLAVSTPRQVCWCARFGPQAGATERVISEANHRGRVRKTFRIKG